MHDKVYIQTNDGIVGPVEIAAVRIAGVGTIETSAPSECSFVFQDELTSKVLKNFAIVSMSQTTEASS